MGETKVRISSELYEEIKHLSEKQNRSIREIVEEAIRLYIFGQAEADKPVKRVVGKIIQLSFPAKCTRCGRKLDVGDVAYWSRIEYEDGTKKSYVLCLDCYYQKTALAHYYMKKRELEIALEGLREEIRRLSEEASVLRKENELRTLATEAIQALRSLYDYVEDKYKFAELMEKLEDIARKAEQEIETLRLFTKKLAVKRKKKKEIEEELLP